MLTRSFLTRLALGLLVAGFAVTAYSVADADEKKEKKVTLKCPVSGKPVTADNSLDHKGGKVSFCCDKCPEAFKKDTAKYATKANIQLAVSGQAKQTKCPISGQPTKKEQSLKVAGVKVSFCCPNCKGKVAKAEKGKPKQELVFADKAFDKAFEVKKEEKK